MADAKDASISDLVEVLKNTYSAADRIVGTITSPTALTAATNKFAIRSKAYVESDLARQEITTNILNISCSLYSGMIMIALQAQNMIASGVTVGNILGSVATEAVRPYYDAQGDLSELCGSLEDIKIPKPHTDSPLGDAYSVYSDATGAPENDEPSPPPYGTPNPETPADNKAGAKDVTPASPDVLPQGTLLDITLVGTDKNGTQTPQHITLAVHMVPFLIQPQAAELILGNTAPPSFHQRLTQYRAGELRFIKDVIFQSNRIQKLITALKNDKDGGYAAYLEEAVKKDKSHIRNIFMKLWSNKTMSSNVANSVLIVSEDTVSAVKSEYKFDLHSAGQRSQFFKNSYVMMIWVVDQSYERVTLYMNGVEAVGDYSYAQLKPKSKNDTANLVQVMAAMSQNRAPRF